MSPCKRAAWLPPALLLLWLPGCVTLSGPGTVSGPEGGSLSLQCRYEEKFKNNDKYWCRESILTTCKKIVETKGSERTVSKGRVSIRDFPEQLNFMVTMWDLTAEDDAVYWCGIDIKWWDDKFILLDSYFKVVVCVSPGWVAETMLELHRALRAREKLRSGLPVLLSVVIILLLLLTGTSLVAWRLARRRRKAAKNVKTSHNHNQPQPQLPEPSEPCYENLALQTLHTSGRAPNEQNVEVEYSTVSKPKEELHYTLVKFTGQNQDSEATRTPSRSPREEPEYSVIKKR
ncbi:PREDICTED: CMRF35-like molecule 8 [Elephantulus edwardii]|uniref:CMRF35-like molecule 8 n=1 Tax=Elephantulus edwardii TaxID=28737 RepID=UPI0003F0F157|nr:PREDICTED: CMRF35-like molecule 8 [Elephantulus edwardii]